MSVTDDFERSLRALVGVLREVAVPYHLTGGIAVVAFGAPRFTVDIDLVVDRNRLADVLPVFLSAAARENFYFSEAAVHEGIQQGRQFQLLDTTTSIKVDCYPRELVSGELNRSVEIEALPGLVVPVVSRSDLAVVKLIWISKGSHKSRRDLKQILLRATADEMTAVRTIASDLELESLLDEVMSEPDEIE